MKGYYNDYGYMGYVPMYGRYVLFGSEEEYEAYYHDKEES